MSIRHKSRYLSGIALIAGTTALTAVLANPNAPVLPDSYSPSVPKASKEGEQAIPRFKVDKNIKIDLLGRRAAARQPGRLLHRREGQHLRRRDVPPAQRRD